MNGLRGRWGDATYTMLPMADGGEGTVDAFLALENWRARESDVRGPLGGIARAHFAQSGTTAVIEMALASGLALLASNETRGARNGSSYGTGQLVRAALDLGATRIVVGVGGTATNDGGAGALEALGARLLDERDRELPPGGIGLARLARIDTIRLDPRLRTCELDLATDVNNPLLGMRGASFVFGPQKGASPQDAAQLDDALQHFANVVAASGGKDTRSDAGAGAGGGIAFGLAAFGRVRITSGFALVAEVMGLEAELAHATMCCTGEGSIDAQTLGGKVVARIAERAYARGVKTFAFGGRVDSRATIALARRGCETIEIVSRDVPSERAMADAPDNLTRAARSLAQRLSV